MFIDFIKGFAIGFGASVPLGPIGIICVQKSLSKGRNSGFITGMGATMTDIIFAGIALFSLAFIQELITTHKDWVMLIGGVIVALFGLKIFLTNPVKQIKQQKSGNNRYWSDFFSSFIMTITNPGAFFLILGAFAIVGIDITKSSSNYVIATILWGVFLGAAFWWFILSTSINLFRRKFRLRQLLIINRVSGIIVIALGIISFFEGLYRIVFAHIIR